MGGGVFKNRYKRFKEFRGQLIKKKIFVKRVKIIPLREHLIGYMSIKRYE